MKEKKIWPYFGNSQLQVLILKKCVWKPKETGLLIDSSMISLTNIFEPQKYRDFKKLIRLTALVLRAVKNFKTGTRGEEPNGLLSTGEYALEEILWIREMQQSVIKSHTFKELKQQLALYTDESELLRCNGRLQNLTIPFNAKFPIFLPLDHDLTVLIIRDCHKWVQQNGVRETLAEQRSRFWFVKERQVVRKDSFKMRVRRREVDQSLQEQEDSF